MTRSLRVPCVLLAVTAIHVGPGFADDTDKGSSVHRVRITAPGFAEEPVVGNLIAIDDDAIQIQGSGADAIVVPTQTVTRLEIRRRSGRKLMGLGIGLLAGAAIGALAGHATKPECADDFLCFADLQAPAYGVVGGLIGAAVGALVAPGEKWETVDHKNVRLTVSPLIGRQRTIGVLVALRF